MIENEKRAYTRSTCFCEAVIIVDEENDETVDISVIDLAAGGLKFLADKGNSEYNPGDIYLLKLTIHESDVDMDDILVKIKIRRVETSGMDIHLYGASFENLTEELRVRLDEIIQHKKKRMRQ